MRVCGAKMSVSTRNSSESPLTPFREDGRLDDHAGGSLVSGRQASGVYDETHLRLAINRGKRELQALPSV